jgi:hypothetical protein
LDFLNRFITDLSLAIAEAGRNPQLCRRRDHRHRDVGVVLNDTACVRACFAALDPP